ADIESATAAAGRALARMRKVLFPDGSSGVSGSMGVAEWQAPMTADELLEVCDAALLQGKRDGKGSVTGAFARTPPGSPPSAR
ncbi:MAG TPA: hypothetical protein VK781_01025, partial [Solirubrobacteraceae bacterium]|nr:hypothetical protein [Solirubrobacteraceae bacterium]